MIRSSSADRSGFSRAAEFGGRLESLGISGHVIGQELHSDEAPEFGVFGFVNHAHTTSAELLDDAVMRDGLADHRAEIIGLRCQDWRQSKSTKVCVPAVSWTGAREKFRGCRKTLVF